MLVHRDRDHFHAQGDQQVERGRVPGILDDHPVARMQPRPEHPFDPVEGSTHDGQGAPVDPVCFQIPAGDFGQPGRNRGSPVAPGGGRRPGQRREQVRVGSAGTEIPDPGGNGHGQTRRDRRLPPDVGAPPPRSDQDPTPLQLAVGVGHRRRADPEVGGQVPHGGKPVPGRQVALPDRVLDAPGDGPGGVAGEAILYCMIHSLYYNKTRQGPAGGGRRRRRRRADPSLRPGRKQSPGRGHRPAQRASRPRPG